MDEKLAIFVEKYSSLICSDSIKSANYKNKVALVGYYAEPLIKSFCSVECTNLNSFTTSKWDCIVAPLVLSSLDRKDVVPFLFDIYDSLNDGGTCFLSFSMLDKLELVKGVERESYHDEELVFTEYKYRIEDVVTAMATIGFKTKEFDKVDTTFGSFATLCAIH